jgi:menaquinone-dependent protoporphyrinogen IX oxidase
MTAAGAGPGPRVLVAYATAGSEGRTELIAERMVEAVRARGASADTLDCGAAGAAPDLAGYDGALVGGSIRGGRDRRSLARFLDGAGAEPARMPWAFFSVCLFVASNREDHRAAAQDRDWEYADWNEVDAIA